MPEAEQVHVARGLWRADLLNAAADDLEKIVGKNTASPAAANILADAQKKREEADLHKVNAQLEAELDAAKMAHFDDPKDPKKYAAYQQAAADITEARSNWRGIGEAAGTRGSVNAVDNFPEPTDEEVLASHGGAL